MTFNDVRHALSWFVMRSDEQYTSLGAISIGLDAGVDISYSNDGFDDVDTLCDIEKIINLCITKFEKKVIIYHVIYGLADSIVDGKQIKGSYSKFKHQITPLYRDGDKVVREKDKYNSKYFFLNFLSSIERVIEQKLSEAGYIMYDPSIDDIF